METTIWIISLLLVIHSTAASVYNFGSRVEGALLHYEFPREQCEAGSFQDSVGLSLFGNLNRNMDSTSCNDGIGVTLENYYKTGAGQVLSDYNSTRFISAMDGLSNYTLEFWKQSGSNDDNALALPIVTIGAVGDYEDDTCGATPNAHITYNLQSYETETSTNGGVRHCNLLSEDAC